MNQLLGNPWLLFCALAAFVIVACTAIVLITDYLRRSQQATIDAYLKQEMLSRGMSAAEIKMILECTSDREAIRAAQGGDQGLRMGVGKFRVELGDFRKSASEVPVQAAAKS
ncbi:MAG TPA: hypothetical protein VGP63_25720 [Planctomycetaceae bacterium]|jgi:hypothetical protein|nr:hypothetical protein [Planctomycetaceae bacterium]